MCRLYKLERIAAKQTQAEKSGKRGEANAYWMNVFHWQTHTHITRYLLNFNLNLNWFTHQNADDDIEEDDDDWRGNDVMLSGNNRQKNANKLA